MKVITQAIWMFALYCSLLNGIAYTQDTCPPKELFEPCICEQSPFGASISCSNITEMETLVDVFRRSGDRSFNNFELDQSSLMYLPASSLETKRFKWLYITNVTLTSLFNDVPSVSNDLVNLSLYNATILRGISWDLFENLSKLTVLIIKMTEVKSLGKSFAENISKELGILSISQTKMSHIDDHAFESLSNLVSLDMTGNKIKTLKRSMFSRPAAIKEFHFSDNKMESLPEDLFSDMPSLEVVEFRNNKISKFTESTFGGTYDRLSYLVLDDNPIDCDCSMAWFTTRNGRDKVLGTCAEPLDKKGRKIQDITKKEMDYCHKSKPRGRNDIEAIFRS